MIGRYGANRAGVGGGVSSKYGGNGRGWRGSVLEPVMARGRNWLNRRHWRQWHWQRSANLELSVTSGKL